MTSVRVFTDGACENNGKKNAAGSWAFYFPDHKHLSHAEKLKSTDPQTNNRAELTAILESVCCMILNFTTNISATIYTDSSYSKDCLTKWLSGWVAKGWKTAAGGDVKNRDLIEEISRKLSTLNSYTIVHVMAHTGNTDELSVCNAIVDQMAVDALHPELVKKKETVQHNAAEPFAGFPVKIMGTAVAENILLNWVRENMDKLDQDILNTALTTVLTKTLTAKGFTLQKRKLHRSTTYTLSAGIIKEDV